MANVLGISAASGHDSGAALISGGRLIAAVDEERLNRIKHFSGFPQNAIEYCLKEAGLSANDIDHVGLSWKPDAYITRRAAFALAYGSPSRFIRRARFVTDISRPALSMGRALKNRFPKARLHYIDHHAAHAASAYFASGFKDSAIITMDGRGEWATMLLAVGQGPEIKKVKELYYPYSLGMFYLALTHYLGFETNDEYKVMGLAPYGEPRYMDFFRSAVKFSEDKIIDMDIRLIRHPGFSGMEWGSAYFSDKLVEALGPARKSGEPLTKFHMDVAASLQARFNEIGIDLARHISSVTGKRNLCLAGGVAFNSVMNWKIKSSGVFDKLFVQPAAGDGGFP